MKHETIRLADIVGLTSPQPSSFASFYFPVNQTYLARACRGNNDLGQIAQPACTATFSMQTQLPILEIVDEIKASLAQHSTLLLQAPPGAGKSTVLPPELLEETWLKGQKILM